MRKKSVLPLQSTSQCHNLLGLSYLHNVLPHFGHVGKEEEGEEAGNGAKGTRGNATVAIKPHQPRWEQWHSAASTSTFVAGS